MSIFLPPLPVPVDTGYNGDSVNLRTLRDFCNAVNGNFTAVAQEFYRQGQLLDEQRQLNAKLIQFMNWLAVTNPQILDEFQTTANAFDKLSPRESAESSAPFSAPAGV